MHHTSLDGKCLTAAAMNAAAPLKQLDYGILKDNAFTLPYPNIWMVQEPQGCTHELPNAHFLEEAKLAKTGERREHFGDDCLFNI